MRQILQYPSTPAPHAVELPDPIAQPGCVLIRTRASLISAGTERASVQTARASLIGKARRRPDLVRQVLHKARTEGMRATWEKVRHRLAEPLCPGYSCSGIVVGAGEGVTGFRIGDRVAAAGQDKASHAELVNVPVNLVCALPTPLTFEEGAFVALGAVALHGVRTASPAIGETVAVMGLGLLGQLTVRILAAQGCEVIGIDPVDARRQAASVSGVKTCAPEDAALEINQATGGRGADSVIVCASSQSGEVLSNAATMARDRGGITVVGAVPITAPREILYRKELTLKVSRSYGPGRYDSAYEDRGIDYPDSYVRWTENRNMQAFLQLVASQSVNVRPLITHRFPIEHSATAYRMVESAPNALGIVFEYPESSAPAPVIRRLISRPATVRRDSIGIGFWGAGRFGGGVLAPLFASSRQTRLVGVASRTPVSAEKAMRRHGFLYATCDPSRLFADPDVDVIVIATPHQWHASQAAAALGAGKVVFLEKPMATNRDDLRALVATLAESGPRLQVGFNRRFAPAIVSLREAFAPIRDPKAIIYRVAAGPTPNDGWMADPEEGGRIIGEVCHFADTLQYLAGSWPKSVYAERLGNPASDGAMIMVRFSDGTVGTIVYSTDHNPATSKESLEMFGGGISASMQDYRRWEIHKGKEAIVRKDTQDKGHRAQVEALLTKLHREGSVAGDPLAAITATETTFAILESLRTGRTIEVPTWL